jgi:L-threonylcarbamoyladenylate synthase
MPSHPIALALIEAAGVPIAAPSANRFTEVSPTTAKHVRESLGDAVDLVIDGGSTDVGIESAVVSLADPLRPLLLRPGMISRREIENVIGAVCILGATEGAHASPGLHRRHYSPQTKVVIGDPPAGHRSACVWWQNEPDCQRSVKMPADASAYARRLYDVLRTLDSEQWDVIVIEPVPENDAWAGVRDRLNRAAAH